MDSNVYAYELLLRLNEMRLRKEFCDSVILTDDGGEFHVHKVFLIATSPYFQALYTDRLRNDDDSPVKISGVSSEMMLQIIEYSYLRESYVHWLNVYELLVASYQFNVVGLVSKCIDFLLANIHPKNCIRMRKFAQNFMLKELEDKTHRYLMIHLSQIPFDDEDYGNLNAGEIVEILSDDKLNLTEEYAWRFALAWIIVNQESNEEIVRELLSCIRITFLPKDYLFREIMTHDLMVKYESCRYFILEKFKFLIHLPMITKLEIISPPVAQPRIPYEVMVTLGGCSDGSASDNVYSYDNKADIWKKIQHFNTPLRRAYHKCIAIDNDVYIIGGRDETDCIRECYCFNLKTKDWKEISSLIHPRSSMSAACLNGEIFAISGCDGERIFKSTEKYNPSSNEWNISAHLKSKRVRACATTLGSLIFVAGGYDGEKYLKTVETYHANTNTWSYISPMRQKRSELSLAAYRGYLYAVGGYNGYRILRTAEKYDPLSDTWTFIPHMINPRCQFSMEVVNDVLIVTGGLKDEETEFYETEMYSHISDKWDSLGDHEEHCLSSAVCILRSYDHQTEFVTTDRSRVLLEKREKLIALKRRFNGGFIRALSIYNL